MKRWRTIIGIVAAVLIVAGLAALVYRVYAPGPLEERLERAARRWGTFGRGETWRFLGGGMLVTLRVAAVSIALSLVFAVLLALARLVDHPRLGVQLPGVAARAVRVPVAVTVEAVRSVPLFMLIIYAYIAAPRLGLNMSPFWSGVFALTLYTSCVLSEIVRAGILSLERGQFEAAESLGLNLRQRLRFVVLPQALRRMVPAMVSQLITLVKDTSLLSAITVLELARRGQILQQVEANPIEVFLVLMAMYFVVNYLLSVVSRRLEVAQRRRRVGPAAVPVVVGEEDQVGVAVP